MAIGHRGTGTPTFGINSITPGIPAAQVTTDMMLLLSGGKPYDRGIGANPAGEGWTSLGTFANGTTGAGVDSGSMIVEAWWKEATSDTETDPTITEGSPNFNVMAGLVMVFSRDAGEVWDTPVMVGGGDATSGTGFSVTAGSNPGVTAGDACVSFAAFQTDAATPCTSHLVATQTGSTFTNTHDPATDPEATTGGDMGMCVNRATVTGTGSAAPVLAATLAAAATGSAAFIRLRVSTPPPAEGFPYIGGGYYG